MKVFLVAGEASGDALGQALIAGLKTLGQPQVRGIGGALMAAEGLSSLFPMSDLSVMGLAEILPKYPHLRRRLAQTVRAILDDPPDVLITIDSPDFGLRVAKKVRAANPAIRTIHYVAPSVWAWRPGRAAKMQPFIDHVLALLPFEPPYMEAANLPCTFVGHPIAAQPQASADDVARFRAQHRITGDSLLLLPGSRRGEVRRLTPVFGQALRGILEGKPDLTLLLPLAPGAEPLVRQLTADWPRRPILLPPAFDTASLADKRAAFAAADVALAASGTVSLELAAAGTPMVIAYDMSWLTRQILSRMLKTDTVTLPNLVTGSRAIPEFIGANCRPGPIAVSVLETFKTPGPQQAVLSETLAKLGQGGPAPGLRAAKVVQEVLTAGD